MNFNQAIEIVNEHIRIGKGMELINGVPEALEMVVAELEQSRKRWDKLSELVLRHEDHYYNLANKEMEKGNMVGLQMMTCQAAGFQQTRYMMEDIAQMLINESQAKAGEPNV